LFCGVARHTLLALKTNARNESGKYMPFYNMQSRAVASSAARASCAALLFIAAAACISLASAQSPPPVVLWHGMGDTCCNPLSMGKIQKEIETALPGINVLSLQIGASESEDAENGFLMPIKEQIAIACAAIKNASYLSSGFNAIGFSQGAQFLRAVVQQCDGAPRMLSLISIGGQHRGVCVARPNTHTVCPY
jgi:palmitoyl-protein thioesterase